MRVVLVTTFLSLQIPNFKNATQRQNTMILLQNDNKKNFIVIGFIYFNQCVHANSKKKSIVYTGKSAIHNPQ